MTIAAPLSTSLAFLGLYSMSCASRCPQPAEAPLPPAHTPAATPPPAVLAESTAPPDANATSEATAIASADGTFRPTQGLTPSQVQKTVMARMDRMQACYEKALAHDRDATGEVRLAFSVAPDGTVSRVIVSANSLHRADLGDCMAGVFRSLKFPAAERPTNASFPFVFRKHL